MRSIKRVTALIMSCALLICTLGACSSKDGIPLLSTKAEETSTNVVTITIPEGYTIVEIADKLEKNGVCTAADFMAICNAPYDGITINNPTERVFRLEGYIFPDTYEFYIGSNTNEVVKKFIDNYNSKVTDEIRGKAQALGYTMDQMLTLASIIQKECDTDPAECANVSSVFHNRLKSPNFPKLQSDVTTFYISQKLSTFLNYIDGALLVNQSESVQYYMNLYSTYYCNGLPAGPICNPGIKAITAAVSPAQTDYYFFLTDASGKNFYYASTWAQHEANAKTAGLS